MSPPIRGLVRVAVWVVACGMLGAAAPGAARAEASPRVLVDGQELAGATMAPSGRILVPMRPLFEAMGATLYWDQASRTVRAFYPGHSVTLQADNREAMADDQAVVLDTAPVLSDGRMMVPLRFAAEALAATVTWDAEHNQALVTLPEGAKLPEEAGIKLQPDPAITYTQEELELMIKVVNSEAYDEPYEGKVAVAAVIVNRVKSPRFSGKTLRDVLMSGAPNRCQFNVVCNGLMNRLPIQADTRQAVLEALAGKDPSQGALYFANLPRAANKGFWSRLTRTVVIGTHTFFK